MLNAYQRLLERATASPSKAAKQCLPYLEKLVPVNAGTPLLTINLLALTVDDDGHHIEDDSDRDLVSRTVPTEVSAHTATVAEAMAEQPVIVWRELRAALHEDLRSQDGGDAGDCIVEIWRSTAFNNI